MIQRMICDRLVIHQFFLSIEGIAPTADDVSCFMKKDGEGSRQARRIFY